MLRFLKPCRPGRKRFGNVKVGKNQPAVLFEYPVKFVQAGLLIRYQGQNTFAEDGMKSVGSKREKRQPCVDAWDAPTPVIPGLFQHVKRQVQSNGSNPMVISQVARGGTIPASGIQDPVTGVETTKIHSRAGKPDTPRPECFAGTFLQCVLPEEKFGRLAGRLCSPICPQGFFPPLQFFPWQVPVK